MLKQECIPVGCIPPAAVAVRGGLHQAAPWKQTPWEQTRQSRPPLDQAPHLGAGTPLLQGMLG